MSNSPRPSSGGMPTWLIVILVILLVLVLGCCGGFYACMHFANQAKTAIAEQVQKSVAEDKKRIEAAETQRAEEIKRQGELALPHDEPTRTDIPQENTIPAPENKSGGAAGATAVDSGVKTTKMPTTFPEDIPVYQGLAPTFAIDDKIHSSGSVVFAGTDTVDAISDFYEKQMKDKGWTIDTNTTISGNSYQTFSKDSRKAVITITSDRGKSQVAIIYGLK